MTGKTIFIDRVEFSADKKELLHFPSDSELTEYVIPDSVTKIGDGAFFHRSSLQSVVIPDSVTKIGDGAFGGCSSLQSVIIPDGVTEIGKWAFDDCPCEEQLEKNYPHLF